MSWFLSLINRRGSKWADLKILINAYILVLHKHLQRNVAYEGWGLKNPCAYVASNYFLLYNSMSSNLNLATYKQKQVKIYRIEL